MTPRKSNAASSVFLALLLVTVPALSAPADGNGKKFVLTFDWLGDEIDCGPESDSLVRDVVGWLQFLDLWQDSHRNDLITEAHLTLTYMNTRTGEMWTFRDRGIDFEYSLTNEDGVSEAYVAFAGRAGYWNLIGRGVINLDTFEVEFEGGKNPLGGETGPNEMGVDDFACGVLNNGN